MFIIVSAMHILKNLTWNPLEGSSRPWMKLARIRKRAVGKDEIVFMKAVSTTVKAPCHGTCPRERLADFLAVIRYFRVGTVVKMTTKGGANMKIKAIMGNTTFQKLSLYTYEQQYIL